MAAQTVNAVEVFTTTDNEAKLSEESKVQEPKEMQIAQVEDVTETTVVKSNLGASFTTGEGVGYSSSFGSINGFVPLSQEPGSRLWYLYGRANLDTEDSEFSSNTVLGYREYSPALDIVFGGYVGLDIRNTTNDNTFNQIGLGFEVLGEPWEIRANGYIPVGDRRDILREGTATITDRTFVGNTLLYSAAQTNLYEESLMGLDIEGGLRLANWNGGNLKGYLGLYLYDGLSGSGFVGLSSRLLAEISNNFNAGVSLKTDSEFGTTLSFTVGASFGGNASARKDQTPEESVIARLGDRLLRQSNVSIREEFSTVAIANNATAINPKTSKPWHFIHVSPNGNSDGSVEDPFGTIDEALASNPPDNAIIYVADFAEAQGSFTLPDTIQVLSTGPEQFIPITELGSIQLPNSGSGLFPAITGTGNLGNSNTIAGFSFEPMADEAAIIGSGITDTTIRNNVLAFSGSIGESLITISEGVGTINILDNRFSGDSDSLLRISSQTEVPSSQNSDITISGNTFNSLSEGSGDNGVTVATNSKSDIITISDNTFLNLDTGITVANFQDTGKVTISDNIITGNSSSQAITFLNSGATSAVLQEPDLITNRALNLMISGNTISGFEQSIAGSFNANGRLISSDIIIRDNTISETIIGINIIELSANEGKLTSNLTLSNNNISGTQIAETENGILVSGSSSYGGDLSRNVTISGNTISSVLNGIRVGDVTVVSNDPTDLELAQKPAALNSSITISENNITNSGSGVQIASGASGEKATASQTISIEGNNLDIATSTISGNISLSPSVLYISTNAAEGGTINSTIDLENNQISLESTSDRSGILIDNIATSKTDNQTSIDSKIAISGNTVSGGDASVQVIERSGVSNPSSSQALYGYLDSDVEISKNILTSERDESNLISFDIQSASNAESESKIVISENNLTNTGSGIDIAINVSDEADASGNITISDNNINNRDTGINITREVNNDGNISDEITVSRNTLISNNGEGIALSVSAYSYGTTTTNATISSNTVMSQEAGINFDIESNADAEISNTANILDNTITVTSNSDDGIVISNDIGASPDDSAFSVLETIISGNTINPGGEDGIEISNTGAEDADGDQIDGIAEANIIITSNNISGVSDNGIKIYQESGQKICVSLKDNTVTDIGENGFNLSNIYGDFFIVDKAGLLMNNIGDFDPADIIVNADFRTVSSCPELSSP
ncbi:inverse autotransporter beta-barrel domain-containing protein [[Leptolyngbya] sp. PCC 7376]|uniref:inverse autotransporter beta-barrel domain-containing protein n=1 Tax=[Leptolyngbya] sp. PCC 7376 TaxID=111781 RepID=UPI000310BF0B|nr:inverse autotransporter beta-barrel domain-containing protein [[Leptolyngbya] sp. PCC 7376]